MGIRFNKGKMILVILAIFFGVFGTGLILNTYSVVKREMDKSYMETNPASFVLRVNPIDENLIKEMKEFPGIVAIEPRRAIRARAEIAEDLYLVTNLYIIDDFTDLRVDTFLPIGGKSVPQTGEILLEKEALRVAKIEIGDEINVKIPLNEARPLQITGSVYAPGLKPAWMENNLYGFITEETLGLLGVPTDFGELRFVVSEDRFDKAVIKQLAFSIRDQLEANGYTVNRVQVPTPGKHPNGDQMSALLFLFQLFGLLSLILSGVLVINMLSAMLSGQIRQIGMMKAIGATPGQISSIYYIMVARLGLVALFFALPVAAAASSGLVNICSDMLNFSISSYDIPLWSYAAQFVAGLVIPLLAAMIPIQRGCKITINQALRDYGVAQKDFKRKNFIIRGINNSILLSIRNTFRKKGRFLLTVGTLAVGGAILIVALNVKASLENTIDNAMTSLGYDIQYMLSKNYPEQDVRRALDSTDYSVEYFSGASASLVYKDGTQSNAFQLLGLPQSTRSLNLPVLQGRWLTDDDTDCIVINHAFVDINPSIKLGDIITLHANGKQTEWSIVGIVKEVGANERAYVSGDYYRQVFNQDGLVRLLSVINERKGSVSEAELAMQTERQLKDAGFDVLLGRNILDVKQVFDNHLLLIAGFLVFASILILIVGVMGLMSSMSINVLDRIREIGVMRAIGGSSGDILHIIVNEGIITGLISFGASFVLSVPLTYIIGNLFGNIFLKTPLDNVISPTGIVIWLCIIICITVFTSYIAAQKALTGKVSEILIYE